VEDWSAHVAVGCTHLPVTLVKGFQCVTA